MSNIFRLNASAVQVLDKIALETQSQSRSDVLRKAIRLISVASEAHRKRSRLIVKEENGEEIEILLW